MMLCLNMYRTAIEGLWIELCNLNEQSILNNEKTRRFSIVTTWFILSLLIAIFIPNITIVIHYLGALAGAFMFIFPGKYFPESILCVNFKISFNRYLI